jgi:ABC-2 type transport system permease protein
MGLRRVGILLGKELFQGPKNFFFIFALVVPIVVSLVVSLVFGTLFADQATLGIVDEGGSQLVSLIEEHSSVDSREYGTVSELKEAVASGAVDAGLVLPSGFDSSVLQGETVELPLYVWGESLVKHRTIVTVTLANLVREMAGQEAPVEIETVTLGDEESVPWEDRLLPFIVLITVTIAAVALPGSSLLAEKEKKTIDAVVVTPATIGEIFLAKGLLGVVIGMIMGVVILAWNQALGTQPGLLVMLLFLGSIMAAGIGLLIGAIARDLQSFFASMKILGILLYAPAIVYLFPGIPQWIGKVFPTYYLIAPIVEISQRGGGWTEISAEVFILIGLNILLIALVTFTINRRRQYAV